MTPAGYQGTQEELEENAQGYFAVYDGHCGSEAVQFVRDRLHTMVGEQSCFWKVRDYDHNLLEALIFFHIQSFILIETVSGEGWIYSSGLGLFSLKERYNKFTLICRPGRQFSAVAGQVYFVLHYYI